MLSVLSIMFFLCIARQSHVLSARARRHCDRPAGYRLNPISFVIRLRDPPASLAMSNKRKADVLLEFNDSDSDSDSDDDVSVVSWPSTQPDDEIDSENAFWESEAQESYDEEQAEMRYLVTLWCDHYLFVLRYGG